MERERESRIEEIEEYLYQTTTGIIVGYIEIYMN